MPHFETNTRARIVTVAEPITPALFRRAIADLIGGSILMPPRPGHIPHLMQRIALQK